MGCSGSKPPENTALKEVSILVPKVDLSIMNVGAPSPGTAAMSTMALTAPVQSVALAAENSAHEARAKANPQVRAVAHAMWSSHYRDVDDHIERHEFVASMLRLADHSHIATWWEACTNDEALDFDAFLQWAEAMRLQAPDDFAALERVLVSSSSNRSSAPHAKHLLVSFVGADVRPLTAGGIAEGIEGTLQVETVFGRVGIGKLLARPDAKTSLIARMVATFRAKFPEYSTAQIKTTLTKWDGHAGKSERELLKRPADADARRAEDAAGESTESAFSSRVELLPSSTHSVGDLVWDGDGTPPPHIASHAAPRRLLLLPRVAYCRARRLLPRVASHLVRSLARACCALCTGVRAVVDGYKLRVVPTKFQIDPTTLCQYTPAWRLRLLAPDTQQPIVSTIPAIPEAVTSEAEAVRSATGTVLSCPIDNPTASMSTGSRCMRVCFDDSPSMHAATAQVVPEAAGPSVQLGVRLDPPAEAYTSGQRLLVVMPEGGALVGATVTSLGTELSARRPACHALDVDGSSELKHYDLNLFNHCRQRFASVGDFCDAIRTYCEALEADTAILEDAITGARLVTAEQVLALDVRCDAGVQRTGYSDAGNVQALCEKLLEPSPDRAHGSHPMQPVLVCAKPGTGKTWSAVQLVHAMALRCRAPDVTRGVPLVPLLIYVQRISRMLEGRPLDEPLDERVLLQYAPPTIPPLMTRDIPSIPPLVLTLGARGIPCSPLGATRQVLCARVRSRGGCHVAVDARDGPRDARARHRPRRHRRGRRPAR